MSTAERGSSLPGAERGPGSGRAGPQQHQAAGPGGRAAQHCGGSGRGEVHSGAESIVPGGVWSRSAFRQGGGHELGQVDGGGQVWWGGLCGGSGPDQGRVLAGKLLILLWVGRCLSAQILVQTPMMLVQTQVKIQWCSQNCVCDCSTCCSWDQRRSESLCVDDCFTCTAPCELWIRGSLGMSLSSAGWDLRKRFSIHTEIHTEFLQRYVTLDPDYWSWSKEARTCRLWILELKDLDLSCCHFQCSINILLPTHDILSFTAGPEWAVKGAVWAAVTFSVA